MYYNGKVEIILGAECNNMDEALKVFNEFIATINNENSCDVYSKELKVIGERNIIKLTGDYESYARKTRHN